MKKLILSLFALIVLALATGHLSLVTSAYATAGTTHHLKTATASSGAATLSDLSGTITSEALTTAGLADYTLTLTNTYVTANSFLHVTLANGTNSQGTLAVGTITPGAGSVVIIVHNLHATQALNGTIKIRFDILP